MSKKIGLTSFQNASIMRKMTILYFLMSVIPVGVLYYLYLMIKEQGQIAIGEPQFALVLGFVVLGVAVGYIALRSLLLSIINVSHKSTEALTEILGKRQTRNFVLDGEKDEVAVLAKSFNDITAHLEENVRNLELAKKTLHSVLSRIGEGIASMENIDSFLELIVQTMAEALDGKSGFLFLSDESSGDFYLKSVFGCEASRIPAERIYRDDSLFQEICQYKSPMVFDVVRASSVLAPILEAPLLAAPMVLHEDISGIILLSGRTRDENFNEEEMGLLSNLALQTAIAVENSKLNEDKERTYFETISALALAVEAKDPYSRGHLDRVANIAVRIGNAMNLSKQEVFALRDAAKLHDIGKIGVMDEVLTKPAPLNNDEQMLMQKHPMIGESIIKPISSLSNLCAMVRHHHERLDGTGYPDGLIGDEIDTLVRILMVADIYDAITSDRPYRKAMTNAKAIDELRAMKGKIDQHIVAVLERVM